MRELKFYCTAKTCKQICLCHWLCMRVKQSFTRQKTKIAKLIYPNQPSYFLLTLQIRFHSF